MSEATERIERLQAVSYTHLDVYKRQAYAPEPVQEHRRVRRYQYEMMGVVYPQYAEKNILIDYGVIEEAE